jgi:GNAT superfamily N-acetyltransferase
VSGPRFPAGYELRPGQAGDAAAIRELERDADRRFDAVLGPDWERGWAPSAPEELVEAAAAGGLFVVLPPSGPLCGYVFLEELDGAGHIEELAVSRAEGRRGLGRLLVATSEAWARRRGYPALTLTTFRDVPWNGPWYARLGFAEIEPRAGTALAQALAEERARFPAPRLAMRKALGA